ncbi:argininosuccinate lyase [Candidatus Sumerlaeota bacterium]|nr:argininosuccinate lyase [Candidatus Sumerlaeota bacterium]
MKGETENKPVWGSRIGGETSLMNVYYCAGRDPFPKPPADEVLIPYDLWLNKVHCLMLYKQKIVDIKTARAILTGLEEISSLHRKGEIKILKEKEDVHITIESKLGEIAGEEAAGQLHTARSRNDQTTTDCRLYVRDRILEFYVSIVRLVETLLSSAAGHFKTVMPGFTHYQPAAITSWAHFLLSHAEAFMRDLTRLGMTYEQWNASPLGAAAGFGASWNIDREYTARLLGFSSVQENSLDCITNRWEFEVQTAAAVSFFMNHLSILSQDMIILSLSPRPMISIDDAYVTGSSIMPQKKNPDFAEVTRAKAALCHGRTMELLSLSRAALSGYNRDTQWTKYAIMDIFDEVHYAPILFSSVVETLKIDKAEMKKRCSEQFITAVDIADFIAQEKKIPFRQAHRILSESVLECEKEGKLDFDKINARLMRLGKKSLKLRKGDWAILTSPERLVERRKHMGAPGEQALRKNWDRLKKNLKIKKDWYKQKQKDLDSTHRMLREEIDKILKTK